MALSASYTGGSGGVGGGGIGGKGQGSGQEISQLGWLNALAYEQRSGCTSVQTHRVCICISKLCWQGVASLGC